jgi:hypothetical protein
MQFKIFIKEFMLACYKIFSQKDNIQMDFYNVLFLQQELGVISCQFLPSGASMVPRYVLQLLFNEKLLNVENPTNTNQEIITTDLESVEF